MATWANEPAILSVVKTLQTLTLRLARLQAMKQLQRTQAVVQALTNKDTSNG